MQWCATAGGFWGDVVIQVILSGDVVVQAIFRRCGNAGVEWLMGTVMVADESPNLQSLTTHASLLLVGMLKKVKVKANQRKT